MLTFVHCGIFLVHANPYPSYFTIYAARVGYFPYKRFLIRPNPMIPDIFSSFCNLPFCSFPLSLSASLVPLFSSLLLGGANRYGSRLLQPEVADAVGTIHEIGERREEEAGCCFFPVELGCYIGCICCCGANSRNPTEVAAADEKDVFVILL